MARFLGIQISDRCRLALHRAGNPLDPSPSHTSSSELLLPLIGSSAAYQHAARLRCRESVVEHQAPNRHDHRGSLKQEVVGTKLSLSLVQLFFHSKVAGFLSHVAGDIKTLLLSLAVSHPWAHMKLCSMIKRVSPVTCSRFPVSHSLIRVCFVDLRGLAAVPRGMTTTNKGNKALKVSAVCL